MKARHASRKVQGDHKQQVARKQSVCLHNRLVDDERMADGRTTGKLICKECGAIIPPRSHA